MKFKLVAISIIAVLMIIFVVFSFLFFEKISYPLKFEKEITFASKEFGVEKELIASIINAESHFKSNAVSNKGAVGLMQLMPSTANWLTHKLVKEKGYTLNGSEENSIKFVSSNNEYLFDEKTNITLGSYYLSYLLNKFKDVNTSICAYNAGEGVVSKWLGNSEFSSDGKTLKKIPYSETRNYLKKVKLNLQIYKNKF